MGGFTHGLFSWTDVAVPDPQAAARFYSALFGWEGETQADADGNYIYTMFRLAGKDVAGMGKQPQELQDAGVPPTWNSYVTVPDVDKAIEKVLAAGGSVVMPAMDVMTAGRMAFVADPGGAVLALWQAGEHKGAGIFNVPGTLTWNELATRDTAAARDFYGKVFPWGFQQFEGPNEYWLVTLDAKVDGDEDADDNFNGGVLPMDENFPKHIPSHWMVYFNVADTDVAVGRLEELGGSVLQAAFDTPAGRIAVVAGPQGEAFSLISAPQESAS